MKFLTGGKIILSDRIIEHHSLLFDGRIMSCMPEQDTEGIEAERIEVYGAYIAPGFINVHVHGSMGADTMDASAEGMDAFSLGQAQHGVTAFLPTSVTASREDTDAAIECVRLAMRHGLPGAKALGLHLEGPWIDAAHKGAHPLEHLGDSPDSEWVAQNADVIRTVTFSPLKDPRYGFLKRLLELDIVPSVGHTDAGFEECMAAFDAGAKSVTHLFNAQHGIHHRAPGLAGAALCSGAVCEVITDGAHVRSELFEPLCKALGPDRFMIITDSMRVAGMPDGEYDFAGRKVTVKDGLPRLPDGTIAGSSLTMDKGILNVWRATGRPLHQVIGMASANPARLHGIKRKGALEPGCDADIVCFGEDLDVHMTFVGGDLVYEREE